jgi:hypothetical protein
MVRLLLLPVLLKQALLPPIVHLGGEVGITKVTEPEPELEVP